MSPHAPKILTFPTSVCEYSHLQEPCRYILSLRMKITDISIHADNIAQPYKVLGQITAKVRKGSLLSKSPTIEDVNFKLQEEASKLGANAVINVKYDRGMSLVSYEVLKAVGTAVIAESDEIACPFCAETIKRAARKCKHCGSDIPA